MADKLKHRILVVDDEEFLRRLVARQLSLDGYDCALAASGEEAWEILQREEYSLIVLDITMLGMSGLELLEKVRQACPDTAVIMVTVVDDRPTAIHALQLGAYGYIIKPFESNELAINVANALERRRLVIASQCHEQELEQKVSERTAEVRATQEEITLRLVTASQYRDEETGAHIRRMGLYAAALAEAAGWHARAAVDIRLAAPMHDVGKIGVPDRILRKPGKLTDEEYETMKTHATIGAGMLEGSDILLLNTAKEIALSHHEKWDGSGYPQGLTGEAIPECARIVAIADVYDALVHDRVYRPAFPEEEALAIMTEGKGQHFAPKFFESFLRILPALRRIREEMPDSAAVAGSAAFAEG